MAQLRPKTRVIVSFYDRRPKLHLSRLLNRIEEFSAGIAFDLLIVVNSTGDTRIDELADGKASVLYRENTGMNIGAWDAGWRADKSFSQYVFLQDECFPVRNDWLSILTDPLNDIDVGLAGESFNPAWEASWSTLLHAHRGSELPDHYVGLRPASRVDTYLNAMQSWGIDPGSSGRHLRSLVWSLRGSTLDRIGGFPIGANYGECIAAEIGVSRKIEACGLRLEQAGPRPFYAVAHFEWNSDAPHLAPSHKPRTGHVPNLLSRAEMDFEAARAWQRSVSLYDGKSNPEHDLRMIALQLKLEDRNGEIKTLREALLKAKKY